MSLTVACLCADWCNTCKEFSPAFAALGLDRRSDRFLWIDIEEHEDLLGDHDVPNFPMILIADAAGKVCFSGPILPHISTLARLCESAATGDLGQQTGPDDWSDVAQNLQGLRP